jgi:hypothetical protein
VNLYSEVIALADYLKELSFRDLDFTELSHDYNKTQIKYSWNDGITSGQTTPITWTNANTSGFRTDFSTVKYPFVNWNNNWLIAPTGGTPIAGNPQLVNLEQAFRPFINIKYIIERIFENTPFTFTSDFFDTTDFKKLYMDFNWGAENTPVLIDVTTNWGIFTFGTTNPGTGYPSVSNYATTSYGVMKLNTTTAPINFTNFLPPNYNTTTHVITSTVNNEYYTANYNYDITNTDSVPRNVECRWLYNNTEINASGVITLAAGASYLYSGSLSQQMLNIGDTLQVQFKADAVSVVRQTQAAYPLYTTVVNYTTGVLNITTNVILQTLRGELGQWEFLKGLMTMFNLVTLVDEDNPNNIKFEPYTDVFIPTATAGNTLANRGIEHDWTDKIDVSEMKLTPLTDLNKKTIFKFVEDDDDFAFTNYKNQVGGHLYGSKKFNATDEFNILDGLDEIIAEPFAATVVKPLASQYSQFITPALYAYNSEDDTSEGFDNSPRIMYDNGIKTTGASYFIPEQNGLFSENQTEFLQFSHIKEGGTTISAYTDFHFGECQLLGNQASTLNNLFNLYWLPYYNELYNPNTRTMTIKVNLSPADINTFKFNDTVFIKNRVFRVNKIDYKPNDLATVEFILIP